jgi:hypothetical protein
MKPSELVGARSNSSWRADAEAPVLRFGACRGERRYIASVSGGGAQYLLSRRAMNTDLETREADNRRLIEGLRQALDMSYSRLLETATKESERNFAGKDPSDACVSVLVTSGDSQRLSLPRAGVLRKRGRSLLNSSGHPSLA